jgi:NADH-ubiquinone oxidoreductase chain 5
VPNANNNSYLNIHTEPITVIIPLTILALFAIFLGFIGSDFVALGSDFFGNSLFYHPSQINIIEAEFSLPIYIKLLPTILSLIGALSAYYLYHYSSDFITNLTYNTATSLGRIIYTFLNGKYLLDNIYNNYFINGGLQLGYTIAKILDKGIIELIGPYGLTEGSYSASYSMTKLDTGIITTYALIIALGLISLVFLIFSPLLLLSIDSGSNITISVSTILESTSQNIFNLLTFKLILLSLVSTLLVLNFKLTLPYPPTQVL